MIQVMACCLLGAKPLPAAILIYCSVRVGHFQLHYGRNSKVFIHGNVFENVGHVI